jgi:hypothetical protein
MTSRLLIPGFAVIAVLLSFATPAAPAAAQQAAGWRMSPEYRAVQAQSLQTQRRILVAMADSMPDRLYRDKATPAQRYFAQQIHHAASANVQIAAGIIAGGRPPAMPDTAQALNSKAGLRSYINAAYDYLDQLLANQSDDERNQSITFFGTSIPRWQGWDEIEEHTVWTAGQVVANFRKHGMAPPSFSFF